MLGPAKALHAALPVPQTAPRTLYVERRGAGGWSINGAYALDGVMLCVVPLRGRMQRRRIQMVMTGHTRSLLQ